MALHLRRLVLRALAAADLRLASPAPADPVLVGAGDIASCGPSGQDEATAKETLRDAGFRVDVQRTDTADPTQDGVVVEQDPLGGEQAAQGSTVTIVVAEFSG